MKPNKLDPYNPQRKPQTKNSSPAKKFSPLKKAAQIKKKRGNRELALVNWRIHQDSLIIWFQNHPFLWDSTVDNYMNKNKKVTSIIEWLKKSDLYDENISADLVAVVQAKFKNLRAQYGRQLAGLQVERSGDGEDDVQDCTWEWYKSLTFLKKTFTSRKSICNIVSPNKELVELNSEDSNTIYKDFVDGSVQISASSMGSTILNVSEELFDSIGESKSNAQYLDPPKIASGSQPQQLFKNKTISITPTSSKLKHGVSSKSDKNSTLYASCIQALKSVSAAKTSDEDEQFGKFVVSFLKTLDVEKKLDVKSKFKRIMGEALLE